MNDSGGWFIASHSWSNKYFHIVDKNNGEYEFCGRQYVDWTQSAIDIEQVVITDIDGLAKFRRTINQRWKHAIIDGQSNSQLLLFAGYNPAARVEMMQFDDAKRGQPTGRAFRVKFTDSDVVNICRMIDDCWQYLTDIKKTNK